MDVNPGEQALPEGPQQVAEQAQEHENEGAGAVDAQQAGDAAAAAAAVEPAAEAAMEEAEQQQQQAAPLGAAGGGDGEPQAAVAAARQAPTFSYAPEAECDLVLRTSDGQRVGVHRLIVLRTCGFFKELMDACAGENEVTVAEPWSELKPLLLDIIYDRSVAIKPESAVQVFQLADKYEAPSLMQACRAVFLSDAFQLGIPPCGHGEVKGHCNWMDMLALASKHKYDDLVKRSLAFFLKQCQERPALALASFNGDRALLPEMAQPDLLELLLGLAKCATSNESKTSADLKAATTKLQESQGEVTKLNKQLELKQRSYMKLLGKHNRLLDKCEKHKVDWHKDLEPPNKKKRKHQTPAGGGGAGILDHELQEFLDAL